MQWGVVSVCRGAEVLDAGAEVQRCSSGIAACSTVPVASGRISSAMVALKFK